MERNYILMIWNNADNKLVKVYREINAKKVFTILNKMDFDKLNYCYSCYKEMKAHEVFLDTVKYMK